MLCVLMFVCRCQVLKFLGGIFWSCVFVDSGSCNFGTGLGRLVLCDGWVGIVAAMEYSGLSAKCLPTD